MKQLILTFVLVIYVCFNLVAQQSVPGNEGGAVNSELRITRANTDMKLDGVLDEEAYYTGTAADRFWQYFPADSLQAYGQTKIFMTYDNENIYVGVKCFSRDNEYVTPSLRRDYSFRSNDNISLVFDTYNDQTNAFLFGINAYGVRREALLSNGARQTGDFNMGWDNKWDGVVKVHDNYWIAEFEIPFKTIRYTEGSSKWRFNCYRNDTRYNEITTWSNIPQNRIIMDLTYMGDMYWDEPLKKPGKNISVIPYVSGSAIRDYENVNQDNIDFDANIGGDAKIGITSGLNLDLTFNPDFSQVEVDQQVTNLDRFEIFFPERRQFFLENADLFGSFGNSRMNPFFSRRIGVAVDTATGVNVQNQILYGARLSGKVNDKLRVGLLNMQTAKQPSNDLPGFNYTVAAVEQRVFARSNVAFILVNKQAVDSKDFGTSFNAYDRIAGLEYRLASADNVWTGKATYHQAFTVEDTPMKFSHFGQIQYEVRKFRLEWAQLLIGEGYNAEVGFVPRKDILLLSPEVGFNIFPKKGNVTRHSINMDFRAIYNIGKDGNAIQPDFGLAEWGIEGSWRLSYKDGSNLEVEPNYLDVLLFDDFDPTRVQKEGVVLPAGTTYRFASISANYRSDQRKKFFFEIEPNIGQFYNGFRTGIEATTTYRYQPFGFIALNFNYNYIELADSFEPAHLWLVGPRIDLTFSKKIFLTTFIQYNNQLDNLNINARFQWRFQPVSDFFLVYTDNYITDPFDQFGIRNRSIVAKVTYWLNL
jgi:hypothetical protein